MAYRTIFTLIFFISLQASAQAGSIISAYTKLDFEEACQWEQPASEEEDQMGGTAVCTGFSVDGQHYPVHFAEGDLRQFLAYGPADDPNAYVSGFAEWNSVHTTIEWRLLDGRPFATIHRWFLDNINPDTGSADPARRGQVLAISTVAGFASRPGGNASCVVGYVDTKANGNANELARQVADQIALNFSCGIDEPTFFGERGPLSGTPNALPR